MILITILSFRIFVVYFYLLKEQIRIYIGDQMYIKRLIENTLLEIPENIKIQIENKGAVSLTRFEDKNELLNDTGLQSEIGYSKFDDGGYIVSMVCPMPGITTDMIKWWFWWHPQADERYQVWLPNEHYGISYDRRDYDYFNQDNCPEFSTNTQYPTERIGKIKMPLRIDFVDPEEFGFSKDIMHSNDIPLVVCGHVGAFRGLIWHTEMAHIFKRTDEGLLLISRFWIGKTLKNPILRKLILTDKIAKGMAEHCCIEYRNLVEILPTLYYEENS